MFNKEIKLKHIKALAFSALTLLAFSAHAQTNDVVTLKKSLNQWQPLEITKHKDTLTVTLNEDRVTPQIYEAVASTGICTDIWLKDVPADFLKSVKHINILNKHSYSGYVFDDPLKTCNAMGKEQDEKAKVLLLSSTHLYTSADRDQH